MNTICKIFSITYIRNFSPFFFELFDILKEEFVNGEVYAGRTTFVDAQNVKQNMTFETSQPEVRPKVDLHEDYLLKFTDGFVNDKYTGIGDLGILGVNGYFIYNGMLFRNLTDGIEQLGEEKDWIDVGASHAVSEQYYTPAICGDRLYSLKEDTMEEVFLDSVKNRLTIKKILETSNNQMQQYRIEDFVAEEHNHINMGKLEFLVGLMLLDT